MTFYFFRYAKGKLVVAMTSAFMIMVASTAMAAAGTIFVVMLAVVVTVGTGAEVQAAV